MKLMGHITLTMHQLRDHVHGVNPQTQANTLLSLKLTYFGLYL